MALGATKSTGARADPPPEPSRPGGVVVQIFVAQNFGKVAAKPVSAPWLGGPDKGRESVDDHEVRAIGERRSPCAGCGDQAIAHRRASDRTSFPRGAMGDRAQVSRCRRFRPGLDRQSSPRRPPPAPLFHVVAVAAIAPLSCPPARLPSFRETRPHPNNARLRPVGRAALFAARWDPVAIGGRVPRHMAPDGSAWLRA
jgi:hypothetical protein